MSVEDIDFSQVDTLMRGFVASNPGISGSSYVLVDKFQGDMHKAAFGDHTLDTVILLASTSKMPAAALLMALAEDEDIDFDIDRPIDQYLPWQGVWPSPTAEQLVSNTSGLPGLFQLGLYGPHFCQYLPIGTLQECAQTIWQTPLPDAFSTPPGTNFDYGGSQWQLAGAVAEIVGGGTWNQLFDQYIGEPCQLDITTYGNMLFNASTDAWTGHPDSLVGLDNPNIEGGAISNLSDYAKLLSMQLNDGRCGDQQVLSADAVKFMQIDRGTPAGSRTAFGGQDGWGYGMGWWVIPRDESTPYLFIDPGAYGAIAWIDIDRQYAGYVQFEDTSLVYASQGSGMVIAEIIPLVEQILDQARQ